MEKIAIGSWFSQGVSPAERPDPRRKVRTPTEIQAAQYTTVIIVISPDPDSMLLRDDSRRTTASPRIETGAEMQSRTTLP